MTDITRLKIVASCDLQGNAYVHTETDEDGDYVTYNDHVATMRKLCARAEDPPSHRTTGNEQQQRSNGEA